MFRHIPVCALLISLGATGAAAQNSPAASTPRAVAEAFGAAQGGPIEAAAAGPWASRTARPTQNLLSAVVTWLAENFELPASYDHPRLEILPAAEIAFLRYRAFTPERRRETLATLNNAAAQEQIRAVVAIYSDARRTIFLSEGWTGRTSAEISVLVHEMVHHLQHAGGLTYACPAEREKLAYAAQEKWLNQFGGSLASEFDIDPFTLLATTSCAH